MTAFTYKEIEFRAAPSAQERAALLRFCAEVFCARFGESCRKLANGDEFDDESTLFGAWQEGRPVGTLRCVPDGPRGLPLEHDSGARCDVWRERGKVCEMGRFAIPHDMGLNPFVSLGLVRSACWHAVEANASVLVATAPQQLWPLYERLGMVVFAGPFQHWVGEPFVVGAVDLGAILPQVSRDLDEGINSSILHEVLDHRSPEQERALREYLAQCASI